MGKRSAVPRRALGVAQVLPRPAPAVTSAARPRRQTRPHGQGRARRQRPAPLSRRPAATYMGSTFFAGVGAFAALSPRRQTRPHGQRSPYLGKGALDGKARASFPPRRHLYGGVASRWPRLFRWGRRVCRPLSPRPRARRQARGASSFPARARVRRDAPPAGFRGGEGSKRSAPKRSARTTYPVPSHEAHQHVRKHTKMHAQRTPTHSHGPASFPRSSPCGTWEPKPDRCAGCPGVCRGRSPGPSSGARCSEASSEGRPCPEAERRSGKAVLGAELRGARAAHS